MLPYDGAAEMILCESDTKKVIKHFFFHELIIFMFKNNFKKFTFFISNLFFYVFITFKKKLF